jgi:hypothetical protein
MGEPAASDDRMAWHRRFAAAANNRAWELSERTRSPAEDQEMLNAAYASAWHWAKVGTELNCMRATMLLAEVHALLGLGHSALAHAEGMRAYFLKAQCPDWELAFVHVVHAHAAAAAGESEKHRNSFALAVAALEGISNQEERRIVESTFRHVPRPKDSV